MVLTQADEKQLVAAAAAGESDAMEAVFTTYGGLLRRFSCRYYMPGASRDDVLQEARIGLYEAVRDFKPDNGAPFVSFAILAIERQLMSAVKSAKRKKREIHNQAHSLDAPLRGDGDSAPLHAVLPCATADDPARVAQNEAMSTAIIDGLMDAGLTDLEAIVLLYRVQGYTYHEAAERMGRSPKAIDNALQRINAKLKRILADRLRPFLAA